MAKIYLASSWRNEFQQAAVQILRMYGHEVYDFKNPSSEDKGFAWSDIDPDWRNWTKEQYINYLNHHPISHRGFALDFNGMKWADTCVLLLPCGRSAHTEAGWMKGAGKKVYAVLIGDNEPELMYKIFDGIFEGLPDLILHLKNVDQKHERSVSNG